VAAAGKSDRGEARPAGKTNGARALAVERLAHEGIPEICALYKRVWDQFADLPGDRSRDWVPTPLEFTSWMEDGTYFVVRADGRIVGAIGLELRHGSCRIVRLAVDPDYRRRGIATALTEQAVDWARRGRLGSIWADALSRFAPAANLFQRLGFSECGLFHRHFWNEDVRVFEKPL
jgi:RimJ/RimL family protein N-acetyltransferase